MLDVSTHRQRDGLDFVWAVSLDGDTDEFLRVEQSYARSTDRMLALEGAPPWTTNQQIMLVDPVHEKSPGQTASD